MSDAKSCHKECEAVSDCQFWIYFSESVEVEEQNDKKKCWLKSAKNEALKSAYIPGAIASLKTCPTPSNVTNCIETGYWYGGNDLLNIDNIPDAKTCHKECEKKADCTYWIYFSEKVGLSDAKKCWLKRHKNQSEKSVLMPGVISSYKTCPSTTDQSPKSCFEEGYWYDGEDLEKTAAIDKAESCQQLCKDKTACKFWVYFKSTFQKQQVLTAHPDPSSCWFKKATPEEDTMIKDTTNILGIIAGPKECGTGSEGNDILHTIYSQKMLTPS